MFLSLPVGVQRIQIVHWFSREFCFVFVKDNLSPSSKQPASPEGFEDEDGRLSFPFYNFFSSCMHVHFTVIFSFLFLIFHFVIFGRANCMRVELALLNNIMLYAMRGYS